MPGALDSIALADVIAPCRAKAGQQGEILVVGAETNHRKVTVAQLASKDCELLTAATRCTPC